MAKRRNFIDRLPLAPVFALMFGTAVAIVIAAMPYEGRPFLYLDVISWLESKIENRPVQEIMQRKFALLK